MKSSLKRSSDPNPPPSEGSKRRKQSRSSDRSDQTAVWRARGRDARVAGDGGDGSDDGASELGDLFRVEDIAQLASDFPLAGAAASGGSGGGASGNGGALPGRQPGGVVLTEGELLRQRGEALAQLHKIYKQESWALAEELRTRHQQFCAAGGAALKAPGPTTMAADSDEELSVRQLYRRLHPAPTLANGAAASGDRAAVLGTQKGQQEAGGGAATNAAASAADAVGDDGDDSDTLRDEASDQECPAVSDVEEVILQQDPYGPARDTSALLRGYGGFRSRLQAIGRLEECAAAADGREMDGSSALAKLIGGRSQFLIHRTTVILGRATSAAPSVDVDLAAEGDARKVSRRAASITLHRDGAFRLRCIGRRSVRVNGREVALGQVAPLPHLSLLEAGRVRLLFCVNAGAVRRVVRRSRAVTIRQDA